jgi:SpoVK/Ycf46/Vps4 family AAA+-type ATPase
MARADLLVRLVQSANRGDHSLFRKTVEAMIADERGKQHHVLAERLEQSLRANGHANQASPLASSALAFRAHELLLELEPQRTLADLVLEPQTEKLFRELIVEQERVELLRSYGLEPRHRILLVGPPGNGKTSLAEALAGELILPLIAVRYEAVVGSYLGETSSRLRRVFDHARTRRCVLFFDEFDTLGKERGDEHETGEIKRVVSTLLLQVDQLPTHVVVVTATNHPELLDRAVWRRFQVRVELPSPKTRQIEEWLERFESRSRLNLACYRPRLVNALRGVSFGELEDFLLDVQRRYVLSAPAADLDAIIAASLEQWERRYRPGQVVRTDGR